MNELLQSTLRRLAAGQGPLGHAGLLPALLGRLVQATGASHAFLRAPSGGAAGARASLFVWPESDDEQLAAALDAALGRPELPRAPNASRRLELDSSPFEHSAFARRGFRAALFVTVVDHEGEALAELGVVDHDVTLGDQRCELVVRAFAAEVRLAIDALEPSSHYGLKRAVVEGVLESSNEGIVLLDAEDRVLVANPRFLQLFGFAREEVVGQRINDLIVPDDMRPEATRLSLRSLGGEVVHEEARRRRRDGALVPVSIVGAPIRIGDEQVGVYGAYRDISARVSALAALAASEEKFRTLFETSSDVIYISSIEGGLIDVNPAGVELFEYGSREELLAADVARDLYVNPRDRERLVALLERDGVVREFETRMRTKSGREVVVLDSCIATRDESGRIASYHGILRDMSRQRELEAQLRHSQKMEAIGRIAGGVAHDFNNILMGIEGFAAVLSAQIQESSPLRNDVDEIRRLGRRGGELTKKLLAFSRQQLLSLTVFDPNRIVRDVQEFLRRVLGEDVRQEHELADELWRVRADPAQLEQVLINLAVNARDAMPGGGRLLIRTANVTIDDPVDAERLGGKQGDFVRLSVEDTGEGMPPEVLERAFEPFFTTKDVGRGSGLGLALAYGIVQQCGGFVHVESEVGRGTRFDLHFPRQSAEEVEAPSAPLASPQHKSGETILLVEDERPVRNVMRRILEDKGYVVLEASEGETALKLAAGHRAPIALVLADVVMPGMRGPQLVRRLQLSRPTIKVLYMSGYSGDREGVLADVGSHPLIVKPFRAEALLAKIRELLD